jgi:hypothetical protein
MTDLILWQQPRQRRMTAAAAATTGRLRGWLSMRHSRGIEATLVVTLYGVYELACGLVVGNTNVEASLVLVRLDRGPPPHTSRWSAVNISASSSSRSCSPA